MRIITLLFLLVIAVIGLTFAILNAHPVELNYYFGNLNFPLSLLLVEALVFGAILGLISAGLVVLRVKSENRHLKKRIKNVEHELENLRALPLKDRP